MSGLIRPVTALALGALLSAACHAGGSETGEGGARRLELLSPVYEVDREYRSMMGPKDTQEIAFPESSPPELLWITGYRATVVDEQGEEALSQEFMCHSNLDFDRETHARLHDLPVYHTNRLFTLSQGQQEIELPPGFGVPFYSDEPLWLTTQVLNLNPDGVSRRMRHRVTIDYVRDVDLSEPMKPLFMTSGWGMVRLDDGPGLYGVSEPAEEHGEGCLAGEGAAEDLREDEFGQRFSGHWVVKPGREVNRTLVTRVMNLPYDTTLHYVAIHLHPFAESLELVDRTTGESVYKSKVAPAEGRIGIERVDYFASAEGIPLFRDHEYELVSVYDNTTAEDQDSMAVMMLFLLDREFEKTEPLDLADF